MGKQACLPARFMRSSTSKNPGRPRHLFISHPSSWMESDTPQKPRLLEGSMFDNSQHWRPCPKF